MIRLRKKHDPVDLPFVEPPVAVHRQPRQLGDGDVPGARLTRAVEDGQGLEVHGLGLLETAQVQEGPSYRLYGLRVLRGGLEGLLETGEGLLDQALARQGLALLFNGNEDIELVGESAAFSTDGAWFAFTARPSDGTHSST